MVYDYSVLRGGKELLIVTFPTRRFQPGAHALFVALVIAAGLVLTGAPAAGARSHTGAGSASRSHGLVNPLLRIQAVRLQRTSHRLADDPRPAPLVPLEVTSTRDPAGSIRAVGGQIEADIRGRVTAAEVPANRIDRLAGQPGVVELFPSLKLHYALDRSVPDIRANQVWRLSDRTGLPIRGQHVLVGDVDSGIDYGNADFKNPDGSTRIKYIWDQTTDGNAPAGYSFGYECDQASIATRLCPEKDTDGHGTFVTGIAAGNGLSGSPPREIGVAPQADIIMVKTDLSTDKIIAAWHYLCNKARQLGEPIVINNSFGGQIAPHDGSEPDSQAVDQLSGQGCIFVAAAGNEGNQGMHTDGAVPGGASRTVEFKARGDPAELTMALFYSSQDSMTFTLTNTSTGETFGPVAQGGKLDGEQAPFGKTKVTVDATTWDDNHHSVVVDIIRANTSIAGQWQLGVTGTQVVDDGHYDAWLQDISDGVQAFANPDESDTIGDPGDARSMITVGNYATRVDWTGSDGQQHNVCDFTPCARGLLQVGDIAVHSSIGPTADGRPKPDIAAPGTIISSSLSHDAKIGSCVECIPPQLISPDGNNLFETGTSASSPHVAGTIALMLQANPSLDQSTVSSILRSTARHDQFTGSAAWTPTFGAGKVDAYEAVRAAMALPVASPTPPATATPTSSVPSTSPPRFSLDSVRVEAGGHKRVSKVRVGQKVALSIYARVLRSLGGAPLIVDWTVTRKGAVAGHRSSRLALSPSLNAYREQWNFTPRQAGKYVFTGQIALGDQMEKKATSFTVVARASSRR